VSFFKDTFVLFFSLKSRVGETSITQTWPKKQVQLLKLICYC